MYKWWKSLCIATKLNIPVQMMLVVLLSIAHFWMMDHFRTTILDGSERRAIVSADGIINGMNMLMLTGMIANPDNRRLFIKKMSTSENVKELRIIRTAQVQDQYGPGLPEEQALDELDRRAISSKQPQFQLSTTTLRAVVPFIASSNFRDTNCLSCHLVKEGSVNGAASITIDMSDDFKAIRRTQIMLWIGQILLQILLFFSVKWLICRFMLPVIKLQSTMESLQSSGSMEEFVPIATQPGHQDEFGKLTQAFNRMALALAHSEKSMKLASAIYQANADAIVVTDEKNQIVDVNPAFTRLTGYTLEEVLGKDPGLMKSGRHDQQFYQAMWHAINDQGQWQGEIWDRRRDGAIYAKSAQHHRIA